jgi:hypothetical protein
MAPPAGVAARPRRAPARRRCRRRPASWSPRPRVDRDPWRPWRRRIGVRGGRAAQCRRRDRPTRRRFRRCGRGARRRRSGVWVRFPRPLRHGPQAPPACRKGSGSFRRVGRASRWPAVRPGLAARRRPGPGRRAPEAGAPAEQDRNRDDQRASRDGRQDRAAHRGGLVERACPPVARGAGTGSRCRGVAPPRLGRGATGARGTGAARRTFSAPRDAPHPPPTSAHRQAPGPADRVRAPSRPGPPTCMVAIAPARPRRPPGMHGRRHAGVRHRRPCRRSCSRRRRWPAPMRWRSRAACPASP